MNLKENLLMNNLVLQKKTKISYIPINKQLDEELILRSEYGILFIKFYNNILSLNFENFINKSDIPIDFIILEIKIKNLNEFQTFLHQGYNNWTQTHEVSIQTKMMNVNPIIKWLLSPFGEYTIIKYIKNFNKKYLRSHFYTYLRNNDNQILLFCSLNEKESYTIFQLDIKNSVLRIIKDYQNYISFKNNHFIKLYINYGDFYKIFSEVSKLLDSQKENFVTGYTTWYYHYNNLNYDELIKRIEFFGNNKIPIDYFQIDDGYQLRVGDWLNLKPDFRDRMKDLVKRIKKYNIKPGIWIAPFICETKSYLYQYHQEWLLRDNDNKPVIAGFNPLWSGRFYSLNIYHPDFQEYIKHVLRTIVEDWGFELLKLDFLYASCIFPVKRRTRAIQMQDALNLIHEAVKWKKSSVKLLGCGIPFSHAFGNVNFTRVGSDVEEKWENYLKNFNFLERVSTFSSLNSTIYRHFFNGKNFVNDPDVFYLREKFRSFKAKDLLKKIELSQQEKLTLLYVNQIFGGLVFTSDPIEEYDKETFELYKKTFPFLRKDYKKFRPINDHAFEVHFSITKSNFFKNFKKKDIDLELEYIFYTNLSKENIEIQLNPNEIYFVAFPFQNQYGMFLKGKQVKLLPHHSLLLLKIDTKQMIPIGSIGHIIPLSELKHIIKKRNDFTFVQEEGSFDTNIIYINIPAKEISKYKDQYSINQFQDVVYIEKNIIQ